MGPNFLTGIRIGKVRHLENIEILLSEDVRKNLILTGKNGSGKTSVLEALTAHFTNLFMRTENTPRSESLHDCCYTTRYEHCTIGSCGEFYTRVGDIRAKYWNGDFILAYYTDDRKIEVETSNNIEKIDLKKFYWMDEFPGKKLEKYMVSLKAKRSFASDAFNPQRAKEIDSWFDRFENVLRKVYNDESIKLDFDYENFSFFILQDNREPYSFNTMAMGYSAVFNIICDLMLRMESQRRYDVEGIVLIDEIDAHLHVELQKQIVPILTELFPNVQFIMTTHSPFVLSSAPNSVIYDLESRTLVENGLTNLPYEGIVEGYFGVDLLSKELREKFEKYRSLVQKSNLTDADYAETAELEMYLDEVPDYLALNFAAEYNRLKLEFSNRG